MSGVTAAIHVQDLLLVIVAATVAGVGVTTVFAFALLGFTRMVDARRSRRPASGWLLLTVVAGVGVVVFAALGVYVVAS